MPIRNFNIKGGNVLKNLTLFWALVLSVFISFSGTALAASASSNDLWDISQGTIVGDHSGVHPASHIENMFGGVSGTVAVEQWNTLFRDSNAEGSVHSVEWETQGLVILQGFNLLAWHGNGPDYVRQFNDFTLYSGNTIGNLAKIYTWALPEGQSAYGGDPENKLELEIYFEPDDQVIAKYFRAEFTQAGFYGPRVIEFDGYGATITGAPVPVPGAVWLLGTGLIALAGIRRRNTTS